MHARLEFRVFGRVFLVNSLVFLAMKFAGRDLLRRPGCFLTCGLISVGLLWTFGVYVDGDCENNAFVEHVSHSLQKSYCLVVWVRQIMLAKTWYLTTCLCQWYASLWNWQRNLYLHYCRFKESYKLLCWSSLANMYVFLVIKTCTLNGN